MPLVSKLHVVITADGVQRTFDSEGDGWVVVAAFRSWLTSPDCQLPMADGADAVDVDDVDDADDDETEATEPVSILPPVPPRPDLYEPPGKQRRFFKSSDLSADPSRLATIPAPIKQHTLDYTLMNEAFYPGSGKYTIERLATCAGKRHTVEDLKHALKKLVLAKRIAVRTVGQQQEWWRLPPNAASLESAVQS